MVVKIYSIVLTSPEVLLQFASIFIFRTMRNRASTFSKKLAYIAIDDAYLIWTRMIFWKHYAELRTLRYCFPKVLIMAPFTILLPNILGYIREFFHLHTSTCLYK